MSVFMMGLPIGIALSYLVSSQIAYAYGWRYAFYVAGIPGLICVVLAFTMHEPSRGASEVHQIGSTKRAGSPYMLVLSIPTMWWLIASGALHNFNMYAIGSFLSPFLTRYHFVGLNTAEATRQAGYIAMFVNGLAGVPGLIIGGVVGDWVTRRRNNGRMLVGAFALLLSAPLTFLGFSRPSGDVMQFAFFMGAGVLVMYVYYSTVYSTIQDVIEPSLRGTAMALYFFAMYVLGAAQGPVGMGFLSDFFTKKAAIANGVTDTSIAALRPFAAEGLHTALYIIPILNLLLAGVLFGASRTVGRDMEKLQRWMRERVEASKPVSAVSAHAAK